MKIKVSEGSHCRRLLATIAVAVAVVLAVRWLVVVSLRRPRAVASPLLPLPLLSLSPPPPPPTFADPFIGWLLGCCLRGGPPSASWRPYSPYQRICMPASPPALSTSDSEIGKQRCA